MKTQYISPLVLMFIFAASFVFKACDDDSAEVPPASTQVQFESSQEIIMVDEEQGIEHMRVEFTNKSVNAKSLVWDFGNGETSTEENPVVTYTTLGRYTVTLTAEPENDVHYNNLSQSENFIFGRIFVNEDFSSGADFVDEDTWTPEGWLAIDNNGDGYNWYVGGGPDVYSMRSQSWDGDPLTPDNWLILPAIDMVGVVPSDESMFNIRYTAGVTANTPAFRKENYGVFVGTDINDLSSFTLVFSETFTEDTPNWEPQERELDLLDFLGENIYIAFRHYNVTDMDRVFIEEVEVYFIP